MNYRITHRTTYAYSEPVAVSHHAARLRPRDTDSQKCREFSITFDPEPDLITTHTDSFGNEVRSFSIQKLHARFEVVSRSLVSIAPVLQPDPAQTPPWEHVAALFRDPVAGDLLDPCQFVFRSPLLLHEMPLREFAQPSFTKNRPVLAAVADLSQRIYREFIFDPKATSVSTPLDEVLERSDVLSLHCPLTAATRHLIGLPQMRRMKRSALLINTSRGGLVDESALIKALDQGLIAGAGFDVLSVEPPTHGHPLLDVRRPNFILTPHVAWASDGAMQFLADQLVDNIEAWAAGRPQHLVA